MERVILQVGNLIDHPRRDLARFASWSEAEADVKRRCGGSLPDARPVPTNTDKSTFEHAYRIADYVNGQDIYRLTHYLS